jgi:hypothetical protein
MKYSLVEIRPNPKFCEEPWRVEFSSVDPYDRESKKEYTPNGLGFFHFPRKWGAQKGFDVLKTDMIERRKAHIAAIQKDIDEIEKLELPDWAKS